MSPRRSLTASSAVEPLESRIAPAVTVAVQLSDIGGRDGLKFHGEAEGDYFGSSASGAGDVNGDGRPDLLIGANRQGAEAGSSGVCYVIFGQPAGTPPVTDLSQLTGANGFKIEGDATALLVETHVSGAGDFNGDGFDDLLIGAPRQGYADQGLTYVIFGKAAGFAPVLQLSDLDGSNGFTIYPGTTGDRFGASVSGAGDVNGDGFADLVIGAPEAGGLGSPHSGAVYVVFGRSGSFAAQFGVSLLNGSNGFTLAGSGFFENAGKSVSHAGDVNGDGFGDLVIASGDDFFNKTATAYVVYGHAGGFPSYFQLSYLDGTNGFSVQSDPPIDPFHEKYSVAMVSGAGDVNGDGLADILIGASRPESLDPNLTDGVAYVVFGRAGVVAPALKYSALDGTNGFELSVGFFDPPASLGAAGDVNGDGVDDFLVGTAGASFLVFGRKEGFSSTFSAGSLDGRNGLQILAWGDYSRESVSSVGDINGDGFADILIGSPGYGVRDANPTGEASVLFGKASFIVGSIVEHQRSLSYTEPDGDRVTISLSKGRLADQSVTFAANDGGLLLFSLGLGGRLGRVEIAAPSGQAEVGLVSLPYSNTVAELRIDGDLTSLQSYYYGFGDPPALGTLQVTSVGAHQSLFPGMPATVDLASHLDQLVIGRDLTGVSIHLKAGADLIQVGGNWVNSDLFTEGEVDLIRVAGSMRDSVLSGYGPAEPASALENRAFGRVDIQRNLIHSQILAGFDQAGVLAREASIGTVIVRRNLIGSDIVAGVGAGVDDTFGTADDFAVADASRFFSRIGRVVVLGVAIGSGEGTPSHGIAAEGIDQLQLGRSTFELQEGVRNDLAPLRFGSRGEVQAHEVAATAVVNLSLASLDGRNGFKVAGELGGYGIGDSVSTAGDVNGDGLADLLLAGPAGTSYVILGVRGASPPLVNVSSLDGTNGFQIAGANAASVSTAGDLNGDGFDDLVIGDPDAAPNGDYSGAAYVIFGRASGFPAVLELSTLDGANGFAIHGLSASDRLGTTVSSAGDVNGDGFGDLLVAAPRSFTFDVPFCAYVIFGKASGFAALFDLSSLDGSNGFSMVSGGDHAFSAAVEVVAGAGDLNGDGFSDLLIGAGGSYGSCSVVFGKANGFTPVLDLTTLDGSGGFGIYGIFFNPQVSSAGDVNGDGLDDLLLGEDFFGDGCVIFGHRGPYAPSFSTYSLDGSNGFQLAAAGRYGDLGNSFSSAGDVNGDGIGDFIIGNVDADPDHNEFGTSYVVFGSRDGFPATFKLSALQGSNGFKINGASNYEYSGQSVSGAGDVNGDGFDDVLVGAPGGLATYVIYGTPAIQIDPRTIAYTEADGDRVIVRADSGTLTTSAVQFTKVGDNRFLVNTLDLRGENLDGATVTVQVVPGDTAALRGGGHETRAFGNVGIPNIGTVILPETGGPVTVDIEGNVQQVTVPATARLKTFKVLSLGADTDLFPDIPRRFTGAGTIVKLVVKEDITACTFDVPGAVDQILVGGNITDSTLSFAGAVESFVVKGDVQDSTLAFAKTAGVVRVEGDIFTSKIAAKGALQPQDAAHALALGRFVVKGDVESSQILAGYGADLMPANPDAGIGLVNIAGVLRASSLVAGATAGADGLFGTADDELMAPGQAVTARIGAIILGGVRGTSAAGDGFGIVAEAIGSLRIGSAPVSFAAKAGNDLTPISLLPAGTTNDVFAREVAAP